MSVAEFAEVQMLAHGSTPQPNASAVVLRDELLVVCVSYLGLEDLCRACTVSSDFRRACCDEDIWESLCQKQWATKVKKYHLTPERRSFMVTVGRAAGAECTGSGPVFWKQAYRSHEADGRMRPITSSELSAIFFDFTFREDPDLNAQSRSFRFLENGFVTGHPNGLEYEW
jgi:hypothetical protein